MSISDLIKNKFVEEFTAISVPSLLSTMLLSFLLGLFVLVVYRLTYSGNQVRLAKGGMMVIIR